MSKKEEALRRSVLSQQGPERERASRRRTAEVLVVASMLAGTGLVRAANADPNAQPGRFSSGGLHPDMCSCSKCAAWRKSRRHFAPKPWE